MQEGGPFFGWAMESTKRILTVRIHQSIVPPLKQNTMPPPYLKYWDFGLRPILLLYPQKGRSIHIGSPTLPDQIRHNNQLFPGAGAHSIKDTPLAQLEILAVIRTVNSSCFEHSRPCSLISHFLLHLLSASTASLSIDMDSSTICHSTATLAIDTNAKAIDMALSHQEVFGGALSSA